MLSKRQIEKAERLRRFHNLMNKVENAMEDEKNKYNKPYLSKGNTKLQKYYDEDTNTLVIFLVWNLPAVITCPCATDLCLQHCYAKRAENFRPQVFPRRYANYLLSMRDGFINSVSESILKTAKYYNRYAKKHNINYEIRVRIHESGDFYSYGYLLKWYQIAKTVKAVDNNVIFQAYTKSVYQVQRAVYEGYTDITDAIYFMRSLWADTSDDDRHTGELLQLPIYTALTADEITANNYFKCECLNCGKCGMCYKNQRENIAVEIH